MQFKTAILGAALTVLVTGCAQFSVPTTAAGTSATDVKARLGTPSDERAIGGAKAWDYVQGCCSTARIVLPRLSRSSLKGASSV